MLKLLENEMIIYLTRVGVHNSKLKLTLKEDNFVLEVLREALIQFDVGKKYVFPYKAIDRIDDYGLTDGVEIFLNDKSLSFPVGVADVGGGLIISAIAGLIALTKRKRFVFYFKNNADKERFFKFVNAKIDSYREAEQIKNNPEEMETENVKQNATNELYINKMLPNLQTDNKSDDVNFEESQNNHSRQKVNDTLSSQRRELKTYRSIFQSSNLRQGLLNYDIIENLGYGYEVDNPIMVKSVQGEYMFIKALAPIGVNDDMFFLKDIKRIGSCKSKKLNSIVDHYEVLFRVFNEEKQNYFMLYDIYICAYQENNKRYSHIEQIMSIDGADLDEIKMPQGLRLRNDDKNNLIDRQIRAEDRQSSKIFPKSQEADYERQKKLVNDKINSDRFNNKLLKVTCLVVFFGVLGLFLWSIISLILL